MLRFFIAGLVLLSASAATAETLIVGNKNENTVSFIELATGETVAKREAGDAPHEVAVSPDGKTAAVVAYGGRFRRGDEIHVYDVKTATRAKVIALGNHRAPHGIKWTPDGARLVVTTEASKELVIVDPDAGAVTAAIPTDQNVSHMVALSPDGTRAYVANIGSGSMTVVDLRAKKRIRNIKTAAGAEGIAVTPDGREVWVANRDDDTIMVFDAETLERTHRIETGRVPIRVEISPDGATVIATLYGEGRLVVIDASAKEITRVLDLKADTDDTGPVTALFAPDGKRLFVSLTHAALVAVIDTQSWTQTGLLAAGRGSDGLGYSPLSSAPTE
ncbi:MAG: YncE family protein [Parvularculaceae bacterium]